MNMAAVSTHTITYRLLQTNDEFMAIVALQRAIWGNASFDPVPNHVMQVMTANSGMLVGAQTDDGQMIGFALAFPVRRGSGWLLWSHIAGVHPDYQGCGVGFRLKQFQRTWALEQGYDRMGWTFDPMQRGNANFNLHLLGAVSNIYKLNIYGVMTDAVNFGMQSDRLAVTWWLADPRVTALAEGAVPGTSIADADEARFLLRAGAEGALIAADLSQLDADYYLAEIPRDLGRLKRQQIEQARAWQLALRAAFQAAFAAGYTVVDFVTTDSRCWYVITRDSSIDTNR
jgi:predicted GNAT superfamily acetyltransferase